MCHVCVQVGLTHYIAYRIYVSDVYISRSKELIFYTHQYNSTNLPKVRTSNCCRSSAMHYMQIHTFSVVSPDRVSNLKKELSKLPRDPPYPKKSTNISDPTYTSEICALMHQNTDCKTCSTDDLCIQVVGAHHRVLVYLASTNSTNVYSNMIPSLVLIQPSPPP